MVQRRWPTSGGDYNSFTNWQTNIGRPVGNEAFAQWLERRAQLLRQQGVGNPDRGQRSNNQYRPGVMYSLSGELDPGGGEAATPPPSDEPPGPTWNLPLDTTPPYEPPGPTWNLPLPPPPPAAQSAPQSPPATPTVQQPSNVTTGEPETPPATPPLSATKVVKMVNNPDGSMTVTYEDGSTYTQKPGQPGNLTPPPATTPPATPAQPPATKPPTNGQNWAGEPLTDQDGFYQGFAPGWSYGGDQLGGSTYTNGRWVAGKPLAAGFDVRQAIDGRGGMGVKSQVSYDPRLDTYRFELNGKQGETAWSRAVRRASDNMRDRGMNAQAAWDDAVQSVIRDAKSVGVSSPFGATSNSNGNGGQGNGNGNNGQGNNGQNGGGMSGTQPGPSHTNGMLDNTPVADWAALIDRIMSDSSGGEAAKALAMARGQTGTTKSRYGMMADDLYGKMLYAYSVLSGGGGNPDFSSGINDFMNAMKNNDITRFMHQAGANVVGADMSSFTDPEVEAFLKAALAARGVGQGAFGTTAGNASLRELLNAQDTRNWSDPHASGAEGLGTALRNPTNSGALASQANDFRSLFNRYLGLTNAPGVAPPVVPGQRS